MKNTAICQSCGMPLDTEEVKGTEKNGTKSEDYCKYCYGDGAFKDPKMTFDEMQNNVKIQMENMGLEDDTILNTIDMLSGLKRWKT